MKIKELIIEEFGKFKNKRILFDNSFTLIYGPNESGKTTILEAIEHALIPNATLSRDYPVRESKLIIEDDDKILELKKGKVLKGKSRIVNFFISMKPKFFRNIFHIRTGELEILKNIESGVDFATHLKEKILELENFYYFKNILEDKLGNLIVPSKKKSNIEEEIENLFKEKEELEKKRADWENIRSLVIEKEELEKGKEELEKELKEKEQRLEKMERARKIEAYEKELKHRHSLKRIYQDLSLYEDFKKEDLSSLEEIEKELFKLEERFKISEEKKKNLEGNIEEIRKEIERLEKEKEEIELNAKKNLSRKLIISGSLFLLVLLNIILKIFLSLSTIYLIPAFVLFPLVVFLIFEAILKNKIFISQKLKSIEENKKNETNREEREKNKLKEIEESIKEIDNRIKNFEEEKNKIFKKTGVNSIREYKKLWERKFILERDKKNLEKNLEGKFVLPEQNTDRIDEIQKEIGLLSERKFEKYNEEEFIELDEKVKSIHEKLKKINENIVRIETEINLLQEKLNESETEIIKKIDEIDNKIERTRELKNLLIDFYKILKEIEEETELFLRNVIEEAGSKWFSRLTGNEYKKVEISKWKDFYIVLKNNEKKKITWLSKGAQDQLYFSLRLALAQRVLGEEAKFFLILDDPFITFDNYRINEALKILEEISKQHQIILASKDEYLKSLIEKKGGQIIEIERL